MSNVVYLDRNAILGAIDTEYEDVPAPQWGGTVRVRSITAAERETLMKNSAVMKNGATRFDLPTFRVKLAALAIVDERGQRVFSEADVAALGAKSAKVVDAVADVAMRLSGITDDEASESGKGQTSIPTSDSASG